MSTDGMLSPIARPGGRRHRGWFRSCADRAQRLREVGMVREPLGLPKVIDVASPTGQTRNLRGQSPAFRRTVVRIVRRCFSPDETGKGTVSLWFPQHWHLSSSLPGPPRRNCDSLSSKLAGFGFLGKRILSTATGKSRTGTAQPNFVPCLPSGFRNLGGSGRYSRAGSCWSG